MDPAALPSGSSQVRLAQRRFNTEDDDEADTPTEEPARHPTDSASAAARFGICSHANDWNQVYLKV